VSPEVRAAVLLLVDDEPRVRRGLSRLLEDDYQILEAGSGSEALELLQLESVAVVISDVVMPGMDGLQLLERVALVSPSTVRVLLTGRGDYAIAVRAVNEARAFAFLTKPAGEEQLLLTLERALEEHRKHLADNGASDRLQRLERSLEDIVRAVEQVGVGVRSATEDVADLPGLDDLSRREWEVIRLLLRGHRVPAIARSLCISAHTVRSHLRRVFSKLGVNSQEELVSRLRGGG